MVFCIRVELIEMPVNSVTTFLLLPLAIMLSTATTTTTETTMTTMAALGEINDAYIMPTVSNTDLAEFLHTENVLIENLRNYIEAFEDKISLIKSKTLTIKSSHNDALNDTEKYVYNPINALTILKRFTTDWNVLRALADNEQSTNEIVKNITAQSKQLRFPSEEDFDEAVANLLRIQDVYQLQPSRLAMGELNGVKLGSEMSWSDCFEIGQHTDKNGDKAIAKHWLETALGKVPVVIDLNSTDVGDSYEFNTRFMILETLLNAEYKMENFESAHDIVTEMLKMKPKHKGVLAAKDTIDKALQAKSLHVETKHKKTQVKKPKHNKSDEELLIEEICRETTSTRQVHSTSGSCSYLGDAGNIPDRLLMPVKQELLSNDPYIVIYHNVLNTSEVLDLNYMLDAADDGKFETLQFTKLAKKKLTMLTKRLQQNTGHAVRLFGEWNPERHTFEDSLEYGALVAQGQKHKIVANVFLNLQAAKLGGAIVFPQLELSAVVPPGAVLYWTNLNEFRDEDYRSKQYMCPVIAGTQIFAVSSIKSAI